MPKKKTLKKTHANRTRSNAIPSDKVPYIPTDPNSEALEVCNNFRQRCYLESWSIKEESKTMNKDLGMLPNTYSTLIAMKNVKST